MCCVLCTCVLLCRSFVETWNDPSPYSYVPKPLFRFKQTHKSQRTLSAGEGEAALIELAAQGKGKAKAGAGSESEWYVPTNPHNLPQYPYFMSWLKAARARSKAAREGKWDAPVRPGAAPVWHPPPPPHDDIFRISRSPNLHDGSDLKTSFMMPPCCDFCMSTYFPHVRINQSSTHQPIKPSPSDQASLHLILSSNRIVY